METILDCMPAMGAQAPCPEQHPALYRYWLFETIGALFLPRPRGKLARLLYFYDQSPIPTA